MSIIERALEKALAERQNRHAEVDDPHEVITSHAIDANKLDPRLVSFSAPQSVVAEQYKSLRTKLLHAKTARGFTTFLISSPLPVEGKTLTAANLAITVAQGFEQSVLLIDADLRTHGISQVFGIRADVGLSQYLQGTADLSEVLLRLSEIDRLTILPAGSQPANPAELLGSEKMAMLLRDLKHRYADGIVLIDTPPVLPLTDANLLAPQVDGAIFVVRAGKTLKESAARALSQFKNTEVLGVVLNDVDHLSTSHYDNYYYYAYQYPTKSR
jgi:protein-tyrosine kinase